MKLNVTPMMGHTCSRPLVCVPVYERTAAFSRRESDEIEPPSWLPQKSNHKIFLVHIRSCIRPTPSLLWEIIYFIVVNGTVSTSVHGQNGKQKTLPINDMTLAARAALPRAFWQIYLLLLKIRTPPVSMCDIVMYICHFHRPFYRRHMYRFIWTPMSL